MCVRRSVASYRSDVDQNSYFSRGRTVAASCNKSPITSRINRIRFCTMLILRLSEIWHLSRMYYVSLCVIVHRYQCTWGERRLLRHCLKVFSWNIMIWSWRELQDLLNSVTLSQTPCSIIHHDRSSGLLYFDFTSRFIKETHLSFTGILHPSRSSVFLQWHDDGYRIFPSDNQSFWLWWFMFSSITFCRNTTSQFHNFSVQANFI